MKVFHNSLNVIALCQEVNHSPISHKFAFLPYKVESIHVQSAGVLRLKTPESTQNALNRMVSGVFFMKKTVLKSSLIYAIMPPSAQSMIEYAVMIALIIHNCI